MKNQALILDQKLKALVQSERKITHEVLLLIQTLDITRSYLELGFSSLFDYLVRGIGYSEGAAQRRISSARLMKQVPLIEESLKSGKLNLTQISLAQVAIKQEEKAQGVKLSSDQKGDIIEKLKFQSSFETKKILKQELPSFELSLPQVHPAGMGKVHVTLQFDERTWGQIQDLMAHYSHSVPDQKLESLLLYWADQVQKKKQRQFEKVQINELEKSHKRKSVEVNKSDKKDRIREVNVAKGICEIQESKQIKENRNMGYSDNNDRSLPQRRLKRKALSQAIKNQVQQKAHGQCQYISPLNGQRCASKHFLEFEHIVPISKGGANSLDNLRMYCRSHNFLMAKKWGLLQR